MLSDIAHKLKYGDILGPVEVIDHDRCVGTGKIIKALKLAADPRDPLLHHFTRIELPLTGVLGVANQPGGAPDKRQGPMAELLEATHRQDLRQITKMQAGCGWVKAAIQGDRRLRRSCLQRS